MLGWRHVAKIDPDKRLTAEQLESVLDSGTDAIVLGGTQGITGDKVAGYLGRLAGSGMPVWVEISDSQAFVPGAAGYLIPVVLNASDYQFWAGRHWAALTRLTRGGHRLPWDRAVGLGYIIMNPDSAVGRLTRSITPNGPTEAASLALFGSRILGMRHIYIEYSGTYGDPEVVRAVREAVPEAHLIYGGGIDGGPRAAEMGEIADTVVVGNLIHSEGHRQLAETVRALRNI